MQLDALLHLDIVLFLRRLGEGHADVSLISHVESDEQTRDHVVSGYNGGRLEKLLIVLEVSLELVDASLGNVDREGRSVGEAKGGGLEGRERRRRRGSREGSVEVTDDGELGRGETSVDSDVSVVCNRRRLAEAGCAAEDEHSRIHSKVAELRAATRRICARRGSACESATCGSGSARHELANIVRKAVLGAHGSEQGVPAVL